MTPSEIDTIQKVAEWIIPPDEAEMAGGKASLPYLLREIGTGAAASFLPALHEFLRELDAANFSSLSSDARDALLAACIHTPAFERLAELVNEGFYTSVEGMAMVGFIPVRMEAP